MAHPKHEAVRERYDYRCGYCGVSETDAGGELTVDHYVPESRGGDDSDENLVYACFRCNVSKGATLPRQIGKRPALRILHPLRDPLAQHFREDTETGLLVALTATGRWHIKILDLNRPALIAFRRRKRTLHEEREAMERELAESRRVIQSQADYIAVLERLAARWRGGSGTS